MEDIFLSYIAFIVVRTSRDVIQTVYSADNCKDSIEGLREGFFVNVKGIVKENPKDFNGLEIELDSIKLISTNAAELPLKISQGRLSVSKHKLFLDVSRIYHKHFAVIFRYILISVLILCEL